MQYQIAAGKKNSEECQYNINNRPVAISLKTGNLAQSFNGRSNRDRRSDHTIGKKAAPPIMAGITSHFFCLRTNAYKEKMPPSPRLSALKSKNHIFNGGLKSKCPDNTG